MTLQTYTLKVSLNSSPEVLERVLRVARHRGFKVELMSWNDSLGELELTVSSQRALHLLVNQLEKLVDVTQVIELSDGLSELQQKKPA
ncbi:acetolactate synthase 2 small subunit [Psychrobium sp. 1_MG-2023]|uniref:acetolactate synthase 2 small subunit n=1 Tax=Psychrobium sp. 1_MG-2023 TaxID=3062624 RepID=UPI000C342994|nr:acetolactate synthase 2 small subunit [Psychrobium sp. 1_MG-2023]MDP2562621.1 acetolactate synthase 2 small subunit [Psychrobium sp. 1_MG-2023]PKF54378.1 acetolactate synthase 2 small subunit [Alteromonadales bacterium alter-6D02]